MGEITQIKTKDNHTLKAYCSKPQGEPRGGLLVVQEIFGVNHHIREVCDRFAQEGYVAVAPALFDRIHPDIELGYSPQDIREGMRYRNQLTWPHIFEDVEATALWLKTYGKVGIVGFCFGGSITWREACRFDFAAAICYYGAQIKDYIQEKPRCPVILHFGRLDTSIPAQDVSDIQLAHPNLTIYTYDADHGFNCDERKSFNPDSAIQAWGHTIEFLDKNI